MIPDTSLPNQESDASLYRVTTRKKKSGWGGARRGAGRKPELEDPVRFTVDFEGPNFDALKAIADERDVSVASLIREAVRRLVARQRR